MSSFLTEIYPASRLISILGAHLEYQEWLLDTHPDVKAEGVFKGYRFTINCCVNALIHGLELDETLNFSDDFYFERAVSELIPLSKIDLTCEKAFLLKRIQPYQKRIFDSKCYDDLHRHVRLFVTDILSRFDVVYAEQVKPRGTLDKAELTRLSLLAFIQTFLLQFGIVGPYANMPNLLSPKWSKKEYLDVVFSGYKLTIQYLFFKLIDTQLFENSRLTQLHTAASWATYIYANGNDHDEDRIPLSRQELELDKQDCLESYFYSIQHQVIMPLEEKYKVVFHALEKIFKFDSHSYNKQHFFGDLLQSIDHKSSNERSWESKISDVLYWYPLSLIEGENVSLHHGNASFNTMLAGTVALFDKRVSQLPSVIVARFIHPSDHGNDYSYGILVDTQSSAGHYSNGWLIYENICSDWSGFSNSERLRTDKLIENYRSKRKVELRESVIPLSEFKSFTRKSGDDYEKHELMAENRRLSRAIQPLRAVFFELFTYRVFHEHYKDNYDYQVNSGSNSEAGEMDIVLSNKSEVILIECKLNLQNYNVDETIAKQKRKLADFPQEKKSFQIWCWDGLSVQSQNEIARKGIKVVSVMDGHPMLIGIPIRHLKSLMR